jgi:hypothetical protein
MTLEARIETDRPERYLAQICKHAESMGGGGHQARLHGGDHRAGGDVMVHADWTESEGTLTFDTWGTCTITAGDSALTLRIDAVDDERLRRIRDVLTKDIDRFGRRDGLAVDWHDVPDQDAGP